MNPRGDGSYSIADDIHIDGEGTSPFVFGRGWLLEIIELISGDYYFVTGRDEIRPLSRRFGVFYPPFTLVRACVNKMRGHVAGVGSINRIQGAPGIPVLFEADHVSTPTDIEHVPSILNSARELRSIEFSPHASTLSKHAKRLIDENYMASSSIARIARELGVSHSHLSRQFRRDYEMSPSTYLNKLRVAEATFLMSAGEPIVDASLDAGYNDLSGFYKQFRKSTSVSPGACRTMLDTNSQRSKSAKTSWHPPR